MSVGSRDFHSIAASTLVEPVYQQQPAYKPEPTVTVQSEEEFDFYTQCCRADKNKGCLGNCCSFYSAMCCSYLSCRFI